MNSRTLTDKIRTAGKLAFRKNPSASLELNKIAQEIDQMFQQDMGSQPPVEQQAPPPSVVDPSALNPNIKNFAQPAGEKEEPTIHKITITFEVPKGMGLTELMNELTAAVDGRQDISIQSYTFAKQ